MQADFIWTLVGFILTLLVLSYILGDNPLFRLATYLFVGVTAGYVAVLVIYQVILARLVYPLLQGDTNTRLLTLVPLVLSLLLLARLSGKFTPISSPAMAYLVGAGAAVVIGGAVLGTLIGQSRAAINAFDLQSATASGQTGPMRFIEGLVFLVGTATTLIYFHFGAFTRPDQSVRRPGLVDATARIGQIFIAITLGALFAGVYASAATALIDRVVSIQSFVLALQSLVGR
jgi:hypothetical protein